MQSRIIALVPDAFGGRGGMAVYNKFLLRALCSYPGTADVVAVPRHIVYDIEAMPDNLSYQHWAAGTKLQYLRAVLGLVGQARSADLIICGHLNLLPFAHLLAVRFGCPVLPVCYGAEAYTPTAHRTSNYMTRRLEAFIAIRQRTADRLREWANIPNARFYYLPNCVEVDRYGVAPAPAGLVERYGLRGKTVIATVGRVDSSEKNKGFDEVIETLPLLVSDVPNAAYLVLGDGDDRERLRAKAAALGVGDRVVFAGYIPDEEKADHFRLANVMAMPGSDPIYFDRYPFRFAFLEPLACGIPVVGSIFDCASERADPVAQRLVIQVDPNDPRDIKRGLLEGLRNTERTIDPYIPSMFSFQAFEKNAHAILDAVVARGPQGAAA